MNGSVTNDKDKYVLMITEGVSEELNLTIRIMDLDKSDLANYSLDVTNFIDTTEVNFSITADSKFYLFLSLFYFSSLSTSHRYIKIKF